MASLSFGNSVKSGNSTRCCDAFPDRVHPLSYHCQKRREGAEVKAKSEDLLERKHIIELSGDRERCTEVYLIY